MKLRIRQVLDQIGGNGRRGLNKYLPSYSLPEGTKGMFPNAILSSYSQDKYSEVGLLTEELVLMPRPVDIPVLLSRLPHITDATREKIIRSKTTADYLVKLQTTQKILGDFLETQGFSLANIELNRELTGKNIVGHPDGMVGTKIVIEVKTTGKLDSDHPYFIQQLSAYMALNSDFTHGVLVLPLQSTIVVIENWSHRAKYLQVLEEKAAKIIGAIPTINMADLFTVQHLIHFYSIGKHTEKSKTLLETVANMNPAVPYQIFIAGNMSSHLNIKDDDIDAAGQWVRNQNIQLYIHAPYIINLAVRTEDNWNVNYMCKLMEYGKRLGASGVVVHVGKSVSLDAAVAYDQMTYAVFSILEHTDPSCPLLIETPAGQGTEMLRDKDEFVRFIQQFVSGESDATKKIGACVDTCHVFACGYKPSEYVQFIGQTGLLRLVHYNDSLDTCGSCKDRHASIGRGHIGLPEMTAVADFCGANRIHMVIE